MDSSKAKRRERNPRRKRQDAGHGTEEKEEADFRRNVRNPVERFSSG
ncbi:hypothetical protein [Massilia eurypsychrophila]|jgi:hypothetical protein|nr:hypothetical protein [Massilia eurypsychrophila]